MKDSSESFGKYKLAPCLDLTSLQLACFFLGCSKFDSLTQAGQFYTYLKGNGRAIKILGRFGYRIHWKFKYNSGSFKEMVFFSRKSNFPEDFLEDSTVGMRITGNLIERTSINTARRSR